MDLYSWKSVSDMAADTLQQFGTLDQLAEEDNYVNTDEQNVNKESCSDNFLTDLIVDHLSSAAPSDTTSVTSRNTANTSTNNTASGGVSVAEPEDEDPYSLSLDIPEYSDGGDDNGRGWSLLDVPADPWESEGTEKDCVPADPWESSEVAEKALKEYEGLLPETVKKPPQSESISKTMPMLSIVKALMENGELPEDDVSVTKSFDDGYESREDDSSGGEGLGGSNNEWALDVGSDSDEEVENHEFVRLMKGTKGAQGAPSNLPLGGGKRSETEDVEPPLEDLEIDDAPTEKLKEQRPPKSITNASPLYQDYDRQGGAFISNTPLRKDYDQQGSAFISNTPLRKSADPKAPRWLKSLTKNRQIISLYQNIESRARTGVSRVGSAVKRRMEASRNGRRSGWVEDEDDDLVIPLGDEELVDVERIRQLQEQGMYGAAITFLMRNERFIFIGVTMFVSTFVYYYSKKRSLS